MKNKRILEVTWLILSIIALFIFIHALITLGFKDSLSFFAIFVIAGLIFLLRKNNRKNNSGKNQQ